MVPIVGITLEKHPCFRLDPTNLTRSLLRQAILYPLAYKARQEGLACYLLGQLRSTKLASSLLGYDERKPLVGLISPPQRILKKNRLKNLFF